MIVDQVIHRIRAFHRPVKSEELRFRSLVKAISWRVLGTVDTVLISWWIAGDIAIAFSIGSVELLTKTVLFFFHERLWITIKWGKNKKQFQ